LAASNLTRTEARERARLVTVETNTVELDLTDGAGAAGAGTFRSTTSIEFGCREPGAATFVDLTAPMVHSVVLNGQHLDPAAVFDGSRLALVDLAADNMLTVVADCAYMRTGEGLHRFVDPVDESVYLYSQFETFDANRMYACFDQPDLKAVFALTVTTPADWQVVSNSIVADTGAGPGGARTVRFAATPRISTYITALVAGPYHCVTDEHDGIPLGIYCRASLAEHLDAERVFTVTKQGFDFYHRVFAYRYPFGKYDQLFVPEFNAGAMENAGAVTFLEDYVFRSKVTRAAYERRAETVLHEMAHMWFGDLVTMRWWDDLWLNESFATYMSVLAQVEATEFASGWTTFANMEKTWAYRQDQLPSTHPIAADMVDMAAVRVNFDGITYAKGASVLKQLVAWVGPEQFLAGVRSYFAKYAYRNTALADLLAELEHSSGRNLSSWSKEWLETAGVNTLRPQFEVDPQGRFRSFTIVQEAPADYPTLRSHRVAIGIYDRGPGGLVRRQRVELDVVDALTVVPELVGVDRPDLVLVNDDDLAYAKIRLDEKSLATLIAHIGEFADSLPRALGWAAAWDMTRDAEMAARDYLRLVLAGLPAETDIGVVQAVLRQAVTAIVQFGDPTNQEPAMRALAEAMLAAMCAAEPGGDAQLAYARAFATTARRDDHVDVLRRLIAGNPPVEGLVMDAELRWHLLSRLAALGAAEDADIDAELARDDTAAGRRQAMAARAARPTAAAKEQAWRAVVESDELPNAEQAAIIGGFMQADQLELLEPYVERYFGALPTVWATRTSEIAQNITIGLYPALRITDDTVDATARFLAGADPEPALRRMLVESRDSVSRALRARAKDLQAAAAAVR
jgi:aminopeptidase N